jgi:hypothetical protein
MKKIAIFLTLVFGAALCAADFWQSKPFTEWSDKDVNRMVSDSPWAHRVSVPTGSAPPAIGPTGDRRGGVNPADPNDPTMPQMGPARPTNPGDATVGGVGGGMGSGVPGSRDRDNPLNEQSGQSQTLWVRWHAALPIKQALVRSKYGSEAGTSPEAKKFLERPEPNYLVSVSGLPKTFLQGDVEKVKQAAKQQTSLSVKGRAPVGPTEVQFTPNDQSVDAFFTFPKAAPFTLDDKEIEFATKIGTLIVRYRFRLKDMVYNGKLEL